MIDNENNGCENVDNAAEQLLSKVTRKFGWIFSQLL